MENLIADQSSKGFWNVISALLYSFFYIPCHFQRVAVNAIFFVVSHRVWPHLLFDLFTIGRGHVAFLNRQPVLFFSDNWIRIIL